MASISARLGGVPKSRGSSWRMVMVMRQSLLTSSLHHPGRHGKAWPCHPRVWSGETASPQANSWIPSPSLGMTVREDAVLPKLDVIAVEDALDRAVRGHVLEAAVEALHGGVRAGHGAAQAEVVRVAAHFPIRDQAGARIGCDEVLGRELVAVEQIDVAGDQHVERVLVAGGGFDLRAGGDQFGLQVVAADRHDLAVLEVRDRSDAGERILGAREQSDRDRAEFVAE